LILRKIRKFDAIRCQILRLKCTKLDFCCRAPRQTPLRKLTASAPTDLLAVFNEPTSKGRTGEEGGEGKGMEEEGSEGRKREGRGRVTRHIF